jgi:hypothetical protein
MTLARRVAAVEAALTPTQLVLRWLDEAHAFGDLKSYVRSLLDVRADDLPLNRLCQDAAAGVRASMRGKRQEVVSPAARTALRETVFRFELVMRINVTTEDLLDREFLIDAALAAHVSLLVSEKRDRHVAPTYAERLGGLRDMLVLRMGELRAAQEARAEIERRYLDGHAVLFPALAAAWQEGTQRTESIAAMACRLAELAGVPPHDPIDEDGIAARVAEYVADLVEPAKASTLDKLGEGERSAGIARDWLQRRLLVAAVTDDGSSAAPS